MTYCVYSGPGEEKKLAGGKSSENVVHRVVKNKNVREPVVIAIASADNLVVQISARNCNMDNRES